MRVRVASGVRHEIADAELRYDEASEGLGAEFYEAVREAIAEIARHPFRWPKEEANIRHYLLDRFPYRIIYQMRDNELVIIAVMHMSRSPGYWRRRVAKK